MTVIVPAIIAFVVCGGPTAGLPGRVRRVTAAVARAERAARGLTRTGTAPGGPGPAPSTLTRHTATRRPRCPGPKASGGLPGEGRGRVDVNVDVAEIPSGRWGDSPADKP